MVKKVKDILLDDFWIMPATPEYLEVGVPYITSKNIKNGKIDFSKANYISQEAYETISKNRPILEGDILISMIGTLGETAEVTKEDGAFYGQNMFLIRLNEAEVNKRYFLNFFKSDFVKRALAGKQNQSTQKYLKANHIEDLQISVLPLDEQHIIAETLDKTQRIINKRKEELLRLDELIKARFVERFGNPVSNDKGWETALCKNLMSKIGSGATPKGGKESYCDEGISLIRSMNVYNNRFEYKDLAHITDEQAGQLDNVTIEKKDVLLNITGASVARCCVVPDDLLPARVNQHVSIIRCKERILSDFVCCMFTEDNYQRLLWNIATAGGATREAITKQQIEELMLIVPPIELQMQFINFVHQVDKSKAVIQKALDETQLLFSSLMQKYFG